MKINNGVWIVALVAVALTTSLVTARMVTASTDNAESTAPSSVLSQTELDLSSLPMCDTISARGLRIDSVQTWASNTEAILTLNDECILVEETTNSVGNFSSLLPLVHHKHYTQQIGMSTARSLVPYSTHVQVYVDGIRASYSIPYSVSDVDVFNLSNSIGDNVIRKKNDPSLSRAGVTDQQAVEWVGVFEFKGITLYPELTTMTAEEMMSTEG